MLSTVGNNQLPTLELSPTTKQRTSSFYVGIVNIKSPVVNLRQISQDICRSTTYIQYFHASVRPNEIFYKPASALMSTHDALER